MTLLASANGWRWLQSAVYKSKRTWRLWWFSAKARWHHQRKEQNRKNVWLVDDDGGAIVRIGGHQPAPQVCWVHCWIDHPPIIITIVMFPNHPISLSLSLSLSSVFDFETRYQGKILWFRNFHWQAGSEGDMRDLIIRYQQSFVRNGGGATRTCRMAMAWRTQIRIMKFLEWPQTTSTHSHALTDPTD